MTNPDTALTRTQRARVEALNAVSEMLVTRRTPFSSGADGDVADRINALADLANFILTGAHPLDDYREAAELALSREAAR